MAESTTSDGRGVIRHTRAGTVGTRIIDNSYPNVEGLSGAVTKQTTDPILREKGW